GAGKPACGGGATRAGPPLCLLRPGPLLRRGDNIQNPVDHLVQTVAPAKGGTNTHRLWNMGPRLRGDDSQQYDANNMMPSQSGGFGVTPLAWRGVIELESFICERQLLDGNVIARGIEVGRLEFDWQRPLEHPSDREPPFAVMELDPHVLARRGRCALLHRLRPFFEGVVAGDTALDRHRFELRRAHDDARRIRIAAVANAHQFGELAKPAHAAHPRDRLAIPHDAQRVASGADAIMPRYEARARLVLGKAAEADDDE